MTFVLSWPAACLSLVVLAGCSAAGIDTQTAGPKDVPIVASIVQLIFYMTPIVWSYETLANNPNPNVAERARLAELNPVMHFIEILREPLLGQHIVWRHWAVAGVITMLGWAAAQIAHLLMVAISTAAIYFALGLIVLSPAVLKKWTGDGASDGTILGMTIPVPQSLIHMTLIL